MKLFINGKEEATTTTTLLDNMNKFSFEAESDSVTYKDCANVPEWGGISQNYKIGGQTGIKVENGNKGASFTFNINSEYETYLMSSVYVTPFNYNYYLHDKYSLIVNNEKINYQTKEIENVGKDETLYDGVWAKQFVKVDIGMLHLVQGNNTITFTSITDAGLIMDKIEFAGLANLKEFGYECVIEAESDSVIVKQSDNQTYDGITTNGTTNGIGRLKVENENQGASFTFNVNSESDAEANLTTYVTPKKFDYYLQDGYSLLINGLEMKYNASIITTPGKDATYEGAWATYFVEVKIGKIKLVKGNNTITFVAKNTAGLIMDKIILTANTPISEASK